MKKIFLILVLSCLVFSVFALDGVVVDVIGKVEKQNGDSWITLKNYPPGGLPPLGGFLYNSERHYIPGRK